MTAIQDMGSIRGCRIFDILLACLVIGLSLPLMAVVAFVIKTDRSGPILSRRIRICRNGRWIQTSEFRTTEAHSRRMRRVHRFLRVTRIDKLPQAVGVLRGDLTFAGSDRPGFL